jgi:DNA-binding MarR family transcriptional regulator
MSRELVKPGFVPLIARVEKSARSLRADMLREAHARGFTELQPAHNAVFATLPPEGARAADMAARAGVTRQSLGEVIRDMVGLGLLEMVPDPADGRAKIVRFTDYGLEVAAQGFERITAVERLLRDAFGDADVDATRRVLEGIVDLLGDGRSSPPLAGG